MATQGRNFQSRSGFIQQSPRYPVQRRAMTSQKRSSIDAGRKLKRRKTRKGTRSCWACKRRKVKCVYASPADDVCIGCARRCLECISQAFPEQDPGPSSKSRLVGDRIARLESMIQQLAEQVGDHVTSPRSPSTPSSINISSSRSTPVPTSKTHPRHRTLSEKLLAAYPSPSDLRIIGNTGGNLPLYLAQAFVTPRPLLEKAVAVESARLWGKQYTAETHPTLIARQMLLLAGVLQHLHAAESARSSSSYQQLGELSRPPQALARRLAEAATRLVTAHDKFTTNSLEGLECLWLEAMYHEHAGSPHRSWLAYRRAISAVHLMGFPGRRDFSVAPPRSIQQQPRSEVADLRQTWLHLVHGEIALCLVLDMLPSVSCLGDTCRSTANTVTTEDGTTNGSKLERRQAEIASGLLELGRRESGSEDLDTAHQVCTELIEATSMMSNGWWRTPSLADHANDGVDGDRHLFENLMKLRTQIFHYHLLLVANLRAMLHAACGEPTTATNGHRHCHKGGNHDGNRNRNYLSKIRDTCVEASRDLLRRFIDLRSCERTAGFFRLLDHYAWQAVATLLLAWLLDDCQTVVTTLMGGPDHHQHLSDRAMVSDAMEMIRLAEDEEEDDGDKDLYYCYSNAAAKSDIGDVLARLLALEASDIAVVMRYRGPGGAFVGSSSAVLAAESQDTLVLVIPVVGLVSVTPQVRPDGITSGGRSPLSGTIGFPPTVHYDEAEVQDRQDDGEEAEENDKDDADEASLVKAMKMRRSANWSIAPYMLRPV